MNTATDTQAQAFNSFRELVVAAAIEIQTINPKLSVEESMLRAAKYVAEKMAAERPQSIPALMAALATN